MRPLGSLIFTRDNLWHTLAAFMLEPIIGPLGTTLVFLVREAEQHEAKYPGSRWHPWAWSAHRNFEWLVPSAGAWGLAGAAALWRSLPLAW